MAYPRHEAYKDSGVEWLGEVPRHWDLKKLKWLVGLRGGGTPSKARVDYWNGDLPWASSKDLKVEKLLDTQDHVSQLAVDDGAADPVPKGSVLVTVRGMILAHTFPVTVADRPMAINQDLKALSPKPGVEAEFLPWMMRGASLVILGAVDEAGHGTKVLGTDQFLDTVMAIPPLPEQRAIAGFLDAATAEIDALATEQRRLIALLAEKRSAAVSHAVTRGLNPDAPLKPSGVPWLGEVPEHWATTPIRYVARLESGHTPSRSKADYWEDCYIPWITLSDVWQIRDGRRMRIEKTKEKVSDLGLANSSARLLPAGTVVLSRTASVGFSGIMAEPMATSQDFANWVCGDRILPEYLLLTFRGMAGEFKRLRYGSTHNTIYMPDIVSMRMALPAVAEQATIVKRMTATLSLIDSQVDDADHALTLLAERRSALISAAVTGKIRVSAA